MNEALSIALPTYNRAPFLNAALTRLIALVAPHNVGILVSDNASTDDTAAVVQCLAEAYPGLHYVRNAENLGPDGNFEAVLRQTTTRYVWLLGDTYEIDEDAFRRVLQAAQGEREFDAIVVDAGRRASAVPDRVFTNRDELLEELGWHMTCMSALILSRELVHSHAFARYRGTSFIHVGIIFDYIANRMPSVLWTGGAGVFALRLAGHSKKSVWEQRAFEVWVDRWVGFVLSLPPIYNLGAKLQCAANHARFSRLFSLSNLVKLRSEDALNFAEVKCRWPALRLATGTRRYMILALALLPRWLARFLVRIRMPAL